MFNCDENLSTISHFVAIDAHPNLEGVASRQANGSVTVYDQLVAKAYEKYDNIMKNVFTEKCIRRNC